MAKQALGTVLEHIRKLAAAQPARRRPDGELLERFVRLRDQAAFAALVERHGPMVLGVCGRVLQQAQDAEDACQATFLVLARKAAAIRQQDSLASWLYGVAYRVAGKLKKTSARRGAPESLPVEVPQADTTAETVWQEARVVLDEELRRLPERYRVPLVLCYLEGKSRNEAADQLGWTEGTLRGRLDRGRERLRVRLTRRGVGLSGTLLATLLSQEAAAVALPAPLVLGTLRAASALAAGQATAGLVQPAVAALMEGVLHAMWITKVQVVGVVVLAVSLLGAGVAGLAYQAAAEQDPPQRNVVAPPAVPPHAGPAARAPVVAEVKAPAEVFGVQFHFSPDGKKVVYYPDWSGQTLAVRDLATNTTLPLVKETEGGFIYGSLLWSPQGDQVAFSHSQKEASLRVIAASGGKARVLFTSSELDLYPQDWSKDGKWILAVAYRKDKTPSLLLVPVAGGEPQQLVSAGWQGGFSGTISPNGQMVAYIRGPEDQEGLFLFVLASRREVPVATGTLGAPHWSPDGRYLLFQRRRGEALDLWAQRIQDQAPAGTPFLVKQDMPGFGQEQDGSRVKVLDDGRLLYWTKERAPSHLYGVTIDPETGPLRGKPTVLAQDTRLEQPRLSPDGQWLVGSLQQEFEGLSLWVSKVDGTEARKVATDIRHPQVSGWFPDGKSVLTRGYTSRGQYGLFRLDVATGKTDTLITHHAYLQSAALSPDGQQIAFTRMVDNKWDLYVMKAEPDAKPVLLRAAPAERSDHPSWSPDGKSIVFRGYSNKDWSSGQSFRLLVIPAQGGELKELVGPIGGDQWTPVWSPNGKFIAYVREPEGAAATVQPEMWLVRAAGGPPVHLRELDGYRPEWDSYCWSADGKTLIFQGKTGRDKHQVWSMTNYLPAD
jgi:RNA polymerase sigma factor (sigma-70 family)